MYKLTQRDLYLAVTNQAIVFAQVPTLVHTACLYFSVLRAVNTLFTLAAVDLSAGVVGLTLAYSIMLTGVFQPFIEESAELENLVCCLIHC